MIFYYDLTGRTYLFLIIKWVDLRATQVSL